MKKRIIGVLNIKGDQVVQSFGYNKYLPQGKIENFIENLNRWQIDEILINDIDRSKKNLGPNIKLLKSISSLKCSTPIIYAGNINNSKDAIDVIKHGADRIVIGNLFFKNYDEIKNISNSLGSSTLILSLSLIFKNKKLFVNDYVKRKIIQFEKKKIINLKKYVSELLLIDTYNEGYENSFNEKIIIEILKSKIYMPKILFGGISNSNQIFKLIKYNNITAIGIGNFLNYKEHAYQKIISNLQKNHFIKEFYGD